MTADDMARICGEKPRRWKVDELGRYKFPLQDVEAPTPASGAPLRRVLFIPDCHVPYHDAKAWRLMLAAAKVLKPDVVVVLGDYS